MDAKLLQQRLGVTADGIIGRGTLRALFARLGADVTRSTELALSANVHFRTYSLLDNGLRLSHFLAQLSHESGGFRYMEEIWGPTEAQKGYEGRKDLGNVVAGDGFRFKGRGPIQLTGRANYREYGEALGVDFMNHPEIVALPSIGLWVACEYWQRRKINIAADRDDVVAVTKAINGGQNGLADRQARLAKVKALVL